MDEVNERTSATITVSFYDEDNVAVVPLTAYYRIDDVSSRHAIVARTSMAPLAVTATVSVLRGWNSILDERHPYEIKKMTVDFSYGAPVKYGTDEYLWKVKNLYGIITEASASLSASASASASAS